MPTGIYTRTKEHREKIRIGCIGINRGPKSKETKLKISMAKKGCQSPNKGKKLSKEWCKALSEAHKGTLTKQRAKEIGLKGLIQQQNSKEPTSIEKKVYSELKNRGLLFETQKIINGKFLVDAYIPSLNLVIEADGDYWHSLPRVMKKDRAENAYLIKCGYNMIRISEKQIQDNSFLSLLPPNHNDLIYAGEGKVN